MGFNILPNENNFVKAMLTLAEAAKTAAGAYAESVRKQVDNSGREYEVVVNINMDETQRADVQARIQEALRRARPRDR